MRFHRPARRIALGLGAAGIALGSGGLAIAATALIQPAGALSVQVPAVAVREQNVNAAGRIRVALPKTSVGVNGSVSVSNLPVNSAGRVQVQNGNGTPGYQRFGPWVNLPGGDATTTVGSVSGKGILRGMEISISPYYGSSAEPAGYVNLYVDGKVVYSVDVAWGQSINGDNPAVGEGHLGQNGGNSSLHFFPPGGYAFGQGVQVQFFNYTGMTELATLQLFYTSA